MKRVPYEEMVAQFARVLEKKGFTASDAQDAACLLYTSPSPRDCS